MTFEIENAPYETNLADFLSQEELDSIGKKLLEQIRIDEDSRKEWMETNREWMKLASQVREDKNFPWPGASNVKYPLLTIAAMQFNARALPNLVNSNKPIRARVIGKDPQQEKIKRVHRVETYMGYQILEMMTEWLDEMDRLLFVLPMVGICYKKTYYSPNSSQLKSCLILPNDLIVNYHAKSFERARMTEVLYLDQNEIYELQADGIYLDVDVTNNPTNLDDRNAENMIGQKIDPVDSDMETKRLYESHCWVDIDGDGYKEPYVITLSEEGKILRIVARWSSDNIRYNQKGDISKIIPDEYFTPYIFLPDPSSAVSGLGLGSLLGPVNESVNTIINQLIDAGTIANQQGGFLGRGINLRGGNLRFRPGEWKQVNTTGDDIRKNIFPMPVREPSNVLFQLLEMLINSGERVSAVSEMMVGENPGQNQPATTTMAVLEQGLKVFTSIYKRIHRSLTKEYRIIYRLNGMYLDEDVYNMVLDDDSGSFGISDFNAEDMDIKPASDPSIVSQAQKSVKSKALMEKLAMGLPLNISEVTRRALESEEHEDIEVLMDVPEQGPTFDQQIQLQELQSDVQLRQMELQLDAMKIKAQAAKDQTGAQLNMAKVQEIGHDAQIKERSQKLSEIEAEANQMIDMLNIAMKGKGENNKNETSKPGSKP